ncbi:MAG: type II secretion system F family protein [Planctomycetales bacterium]|nr:type II secretion system F family protein [Planctomycetales bacterium]
MSAFAALTPTTVTLEDFLALNHEIAALARAGVPLGPGLMAFGRDLPSRLGKIAAEVGARLEQGEPLDRIIATQQGLPSAYKAVVQAGLRVGRLPAALEGISQSARRTAQLRWTIGMAIIYPLVVMSVGYCLFIFTLTHLAPVMAAALADHGVEDTPVHHGLIWLGKTVPIWGIALPVLILSWLTWLWWRAGRVSAGVELHPLLSFGAVSTMVAMRHAGRLAAMCDCLALLTEYGVPLPEAIPLAARTTGAKKLDAAASELAEQMTRGERHASLPKHFPPLLAWMLTSGRLQQGLPPALRRAADAYRDEANRRAQWLRLYVPLILTLGFGGGTAIIYAIVTLGPYLFILYRFSEAGFRP